VNADASQVTHLPLFRNLDTAALAPLFKAFKSRTLAKGEVLFRAGEISKVFQLLAAGELSLAEPGEPPIVLRPVSPIGELGALAGLPRNATATALTEVTVLELPSAELTVLLDATPALALGFYRNLIEVVADKVRRDKGRTDEIRSNLIRTQKSMKELRDIVLSAEETSLSQPLCDKLDELIEKNRRGHYRVAPTATHPAELRLEGKKVAIIELSEGFLKLSNDAGFDAGTEVSGVLSLPRHELAVSGRVERVGTDGALLKLDLLIEEYKTALSAYMTELQMLDFVV
jgi:CRP/FNR family cyclic AMP-dependent transcriptional regulator